MGLGPSVVVGRQQDPHTAAVVEAAEDLSAEVILFDAQTLSEADFLLDDRGAYLFGTASEPVSLAGCRGWLRRLAPETWREGVTIDSHAGVVQQAWTTAVSVLVELAQVTWLTSLRHIFAAEDKLTQRRASRELGINSPPGVLLTRRERIPAEFGERLVVKPFAAGHYRAQGGEARVIFATPMRRDDSRLDLLAGAPFLVQPELDAESHLRVVTVGERAWVSELKAESLSFDWRATAAAHSAFRASENPEVAAQAVQLTTKLSVGYSSQDWLVDTEGVAHFLDLNPAGQWLFLPDRVSDAVTLAIAEWLVGK